MTAQVEGNKYWAEINLSEGVSDSVQQVKDLWTDATTRVKEVTTKAVETVGEVADRSIDTIAQTAQQAIDKTKDSLTQTLSQTENLGGAVANNMQSAIASSVNVWLQDHPNVFKLLEGLIWMTNHPIISLLVLLVAIAVAWQLIKGVGYLMEVVGRAIVQAPFRLLQFSATSAGKIGSFAIQTITKKKELLALPPANSLPVQPDKQQRLAEISRRLESIQKEQNELLQEVATIMAEEKVNLEV
jgi:hypothetical protein